jgi:hypothetical protein
MVTDAAMVAMETLMVAMEMAMVAMETAMETTKAMATMDIIETNGPFLEVETNKHFYFEIDMCL